MLRILFESNDDSDSARYNNPSFFFVPALLLFSIAHFGLNTTSNLETYMDENLRLEDLFQRVFEFAMSGFCQGVPEAASERDRYAILGIQTQLKVWIEGVINDYLKDICEARAIHMDNLRQASRGERIRLEQELENEINGKITECINRINSKKEEIISSLYPEEEKQSSLVLS